MGAHAHTHTHTHRVSTIFKDNGDVYMSMPLSHFVPAYPSPSLCVGIGRVGERHKGRRYGDICICIADSLCHTEETNTPL